MGVAGILFALTLEAQGAAAADLRAPNANVARVKAERQARARAEDKLREQLKARKLDEKLLERAKVSEIRWGSDGSVWLKLLLSTDAPK